MPEEVVLNSPSHQLSVCSENKPWNTCAVTMPIIYKTQKEYSMQNLWIKFRIAQHNKLHVFRLTGVCFAHSLCTYRWCEFYIHTLIFSTLGSYNSHAKGLIHCSVMLTFFLLSKILKNWKAISSFVNSKFFIQNDHFWKERAWGFGMRKTGYLSPHWSRWTHWAY